MKDIESSLLAKSGYATVKIATEFLNLEKGDRIKTVSELEEIYPFSRGTIQNALNSLKELKAISTVAKGHKGTVLEDKNINILLKIMGIDSIVGCMPLPYSKRYEGLATGLIASIENRYDVVCNLAFVRGAKNRIAMLMTDRYDYAIVSKYAAKQVLKTNDDIEILKELGHGSYLSDHVIVFHNPKEINIKNGMKIGIDVSSVDHQNLTELVCKNKKVEYVNLNYNNVLKKCISGDIDAVVLNKDEIFDKYIDIKYVPIDVKNSDDTIAVVMVNKKRKEIASFLNTAIDVDIVLKNQTMVINGLITPSY